MFFFFRNSDIAILVDDPGNSDWNDKQVANQSQDEDGDTFGS